MTLQLDRALVGTAVLVCVMLGCGSAPAAATAEVGTTDGTSGSTTTTSSSSTDAESSEASTSDATGIAEDSSSSDGDGSTSSTTDDDACVVEVAACVAPDDGGDQPCSTFAQDCPPGEKCILVDGPSGAPEGTACTPLPVAPGGLGDPCTFDGWHNDCDAGLTCTDGACSRMCSCSFETPVCETPNEWCFAFSELGGVCVPWCDPLDPGACGDGEACTALLVLGSVAFNCIASQGGAPGDPCFGTPSVCGPGQLCAPNEAFTACAEAGGCCASFCTVGDDSPCLTGQSCRPWFGAGGAPAECLQATGICSV